MLIFLAFSWVMPSLRATSRRYSLPGRLAGRLAEVEGLERDLALDQLGLEDVEDGADPLLGVGLHEDVVAAPLDRGADVLEVVALGDLLLRLGRARCRPPACRPCSRCRTTSRPCVSLRWCLGRGAGPADGTRLRLAGPGSACYPSMPHHGRLPERPMGADCKSVAKASKVRILHLPPAGCFTRHRTPTMCGGSVFPPETGGPKRPVRQILRGSGPDR